MKGLLLFCGDTFLRTCDGSDPFAHIADLFSESVVCLNLETALKGEKQKKKNVCLCLEEPSLNLIPESVKILTIVNNHTEDGGDPARFIVALKKRGKIVIGPESPSTEHTTIDSISVDFFSAYFHLPRLRVSYNGPHANSLERMLLKSVAQRKIVNLHWGYEHTDVPAPFQRELAHRLVDAGADIIIGHHPHVPQGTEIYKGKTIFYSLGNFNFWQFNSETTEKNRCGYMVSYDLVSKNAKPIPYRINENFQPYRVISNEEADLLSRLNNLSEAVHTIDIGTWFKTEYAKWYAREMGVWKCCCFQRRSPQFFLKWVAWMCMPMQLKYYAYAVRYRIRAILRRK